MPIGKLMSVEGGEGSTKSTQADLLCKYLRSNGIDAVLLREPGGIKFSEELRKLVLSPEYKDYVDPMTAMHMFFAARGPFYRHVVIPAIHTGKWPVLDRTGDSTTAYQGYGDGIDLDLIERLNKESTMNTKPDLTFLLNISAADGLLKTTTTEFGEKDRIESKGLVYHDRVNKGFLEIAKKEPKRIKVINYIPGGVQEMHEQIKKYVDEFLRK